jgi:deoxyribodipyrimidine photolyase-related protein
MQHVLVLGDQLTRQVGPLAAAEPGRTRVLMIESLELARSMRHHKQKLVLVFAAMRHFAAELRAAGFAVTYLRSASFGDGVEKYLQQYPGATLTLMEPSDYGYSTMMQDAAERAGGALQLVPNALWITSQDDFERWASGKRTLRMEHFYRWQRRRTGWLMDGDRPLGGRWNFDRENRRMLPPGTPVPPPLRFAPDALTRKVIAEVARDFPDHFGSLERFAWPVTRRQALAALDDFCAHRLANFGPYEDAMVEREPVLFHSLLSAPLNLGLLHPREVCEATLSYQGRVPLASLEGFIRQVLGWREFMFHSYRRLMPSLREANTLGHTLPLPWFYWSGETTMHCLRSVVRQLQATGHTHHIQRLMVLGNFALLAGVNPQELNAWFLATYVDALDWVVTSNVIGMSQYAEGGSFTSKPYAASARYLHAMGDYCQRCCYDPLAITGDDACPFNSLYWDFIARHHERFATHPRMSLPVRQWQRRSEAERRAILAQAHKVKARLAEGSL